MTMYRKTIIGSIFAVLAIIALVIFIPAKVADSKEQQAARTLEVAYAETFAVAKSTALKHLFSDTFDVTVQSMNSSIVYDFTMQGEQFTGDYYTEQLHVAVAKLVENQVEGLVLAKTDVTGLTVATRLQDAPITAVELMLLTEQPLTKQQATALAQTLKGALGDVHIQLDVLIVEDEEAFTGVSYEIQHFFQQSTITQESFTGLAFEEQQFQF